MTKNIITNSWGHKLEVENALDKIIELKVEKLELIKKTWPPNG